jgi:hypothetical protein
MNTTTNPDRIHCTCSHCDNWLIASAKRPGLCNNCKTFIHRDGYTGKVITDETRIIANHARGYAR